MEFGKSYEVAVLSYKDGPSLLKCLERVSRMLQEYRGGVATLYFVDDGDLPSSLQEWCSGLGIHLVVEPRRLGKARSVERALLLARAPIVILVGGDGVPCLEAPKIAMEALTDPTVGGLGSRNVPVNAGDSGVAMAMALLWELHDCVNLMEPKLGGDMVAVKVAPLAGRPLLAVDDASEEEILISQGLRVLYSRGFFVEMRVPTRFRDAVAQRRRIAAQYRELERGRPQYRVSTRRWGNLLRLLPYALSSRYAPFLPLLLLIEAVSRLLAWIDAWRGRDYLRWEPLVTTKMD